MKVNCIHAIDIETLNCVECTLGLYGGKPSIYICNGICTKKEPIHMPEINNALTGEEKFNTCQYKSNEEVSIIKKTCCSSHIINGFKCEKLGIHPLSSKNCEGCNQY